MDKLRAEWKNLVEVVIVLRKDVKSLKYTASGRHRPATGTLRDKLWVEKIRLRSNLRYLGLALCMFKGIPYSKVEKTTKKPPQIGRIQEVIYTTCDIRMEKARIELWIKGPPVIGIPRYGDEDSTVSD